MPLSATARWALSLISSISSLALVLSSKPDVETGLKPCPLHRRWRPRYAGKVLRRRAGSFQSRNRKRSKAHPGGPQILAARRRHYPRRPFPDERPLVRRAFLTRAVREDRRRPARKLDR